MLDESILKLKNNSTDLYKYVFPPDLTHPTLAIVGHVQAIGSVIPIAEMQARWISRIFNGKYRILFTMKLHAYQSFVESMTKMQCYPFQENAHCLVKKKC